MIVPCLHQIQNMGQSAKQALAANGGPFHNGQQPLIDPLDKNRHSSQLKELGIPGIFDIHVHFFPDTVMKAIWRWFEQAQWPIAYKQSEQTRVATLARHDVVQYTTLFYAHKANMAQGLNDWLFQNRRNIGPAVLTGTFFPEPNVLEYVQRAVNEYHFQAFKLHLEVSDFNLATHELAPTFSWLEDRQIPLIIHCGSAPIAGKNTGLEHFRAFIKNHPRLKVIVAHMGAWEIEAFCQLLADFPHVGLDTTMIFVDYLMPELKWRKLLPLLETWQDRIYFGTDFPSIPYNYSHPVMNLLTATEISAEAKRKIFYHNAKRLFG